MAKLKILPFIICLALLM